MQYIVDLYLHLHWSTNCEFGFRFSGTLSLGISIFLQYLQGPLPRLRAEVVHVGRDGLPDQVGVKLRAA